MQKKEKLTDWTIADFVSEDAISGKRESSPIEGFDHCYNSQFTTITETHIGVMFLPVESEYLQINYEIH